MLVTASPGDFNLMIRSPFLASTTFTGRGVSLTFRASSAESFAEYLFGKNHFPAFFCQLPKTQT